MSPIAMARSASPPGNYLFRVRTSDDLQTLGAVYGGATTRTYVDANGKVQTAPIGAPRAIYSGVDRRNFRDGVGRISTEDQRTNLTLSSNDFSTANWSFTAMTQTPAAAVGGDGNMTATALKETVANSQHRIFAVNATVVSGSTYTYTAVIGYLGRQWVWFRPDTGSGVGAYFDVLNGVWGTAGAGVTTFPPVQLTGGLWKVSLKAAAAGASVSWSIWMTTADNVGATAYVGDVTKGLYIWHAQTTLGATPSSLIFTTSGTVTCSADSLYFLLTGAAAVSGNRTLYVKAVDLGTYAVGAAFVDVGDTASGANPRWVIYNDGTGYSGRFGAPAGSIRPLATFGDTVEARCTLDSAFVVQLSTSINGGAEGSATAQPSTPGSYAGNRLWVNVLAGGVIGFADFESIAILDTASQTLAQCRAAMN